MVDDAIAFFQAFDGHGGRASATGPSAVLELLSDAEHRVRARGRRPGGDTVEEATFFAERLAEAGIPVAGARRQPHAPAVRRQPRRGHARSGRGTLAGTDLGGLYANLADFAAGRCRARRTTSPAWPSGSRPPRSCGCRSSTATCTTSTAWTPSPRTCFGSLARCPRSSLRPTPTGSSTRCVRRSAARPRPSAGCATARTSCPRSDARAADLVVLDLQIGNMGGMATCMDIRLESGAGRLPDVGVLMLLDRSADVFLAQRSNADGWLIKPLDAFRLRRAADAILRDETYQEGVPEAV